MINDTLIMITIMHSSFVWTSVCRPIATGELCLKAAKALTSSAHICVVPFVIQFVTVRLSSDSYWFEHSASKKIPAPSSEYVSTISTYRGQVHTPFCIHMPTFYSWTMYYIPNCPLCIMLYWYSLIKPQYRDWFSALQQMICCFFYILRIANHINIECQRTYSVYRMSQKKLQSDFPHQ